MKFAQITAMVNGRKVQVREFLLNDSPEELRYWAERKLRQRAAYAIGKQVLDDQDAAVVYEDVL